MLDKLNRPLHDLRISVTDKCNFRCTYCMPKEIFNSKYKYLNKEKLLSFDEIVHIVKIFKNFGVEKIRLTGGEPLLRKEIEKLIEKIANVGFKDITLTTNGALLSKKAQILKDAGLNRVTVSLDSLNDATFQKMNDVKFPVKKVLEGIEKAHEVGLGPIKVNMVVKKGVNELEILPMVNYFHKTPFILRFIEFMDVGSTNGWNLDSVLPSEEIVNIIKTKFEITPSKSNYKGEVARRWKFDNFDNEVGFISSVTQAFCSDCSRIRISADGKLYTCLFATSGLDIKSLIRSGESVDEVIKNLWINRVDKYSEIRTIETRELRKKVEMSYIGG